MAQTNFTPILLYASSTAAAVPSAGNLTNSATGSEIAINVADKNLFFKDSGGTVNTVPIRQSSTSSNGWLSSTDWSTFNGKAPAVTYTTNYIPFGQGTTTPNQSAGLQFDGTNFTTTGYAAATSFRPSSSTVPTNGLYLPAANQLGFATNTALVATMFSSGGVSIGNTTDPGAGVLFVSSGVRFPATQSASSDANTLDDYEEGTWTPNQGAGLTVVGAFSSAGTYTKVGNLVTITGRVDGATSIAMAGTYSNICTNLPFTASQFAQGGLINANFNFGEIITVAAGSTTLLNTVAVPASTVILFSLTYPV